MGVLEHIIRSLLRIRLLWHSELIPMKKETAHLICYENLRLLLYVYTFDLI